MNQVAPETSGAKQEVSTPSRAAFAFIFVTVLLDMLALGIIIPVLPRLVVDFMGGDAPGAAEVIGIFGTAWALMQFLFSPMVGALSDRFGRRPVILISNVGLGLDYILMALARALVSSWTVQRFDRSRLATRRAISAGASSGIGNTELTLISPST